jgi:guanosine-3',5'-bis(diphosphate) 3'-pyrophosphohydrolase
MNIEHFTVDDIAVLLKAIKFAADKHQHQRRKNEWASPYINHLITVSQILWEIGAVRDMHILVAALLHDTLEDTDTSVAELEQTFGRTICTIVQEVTDDKTLPKQVRKQLQIEHASQASFEARQIKLADKIANVLDLIDAPPADWSWERRWEYVNWAEAVINRLRGSNDQLEQYFDQVCRAVRQKLEAEKGG